MPRKNLVLAIAAVLAIGGCARKETAPPAAMAPSPAATAASASPQAATAPTTAVAVGEEVFRKACRACHEMGIAGAPKLGDAADWGPRIAQGMDVLYRHSLQGFTGKKGVMLPKGGFSTLSDAEVTAAVDYMVARAR